MENYSENFEELQNSWWPILIATIISVLGVIRLYVRGIECPSKNRIDGKLVIITGGSNGIGLETARELVKRGGNVILAVRNNQKGIEALNLIKNDFPDSKIVVKLIDLSDFTSIRNFSQEINKEYEKIDILINNAGIIFHPYKKTRDGNELTMTTNYFGPFLLSHLLLDLLKKSENGRVINVSSSAHYNAEIRLDDLNSEKEYSDRVFAQSKLALTIFTKHMASTLKNTKITFNAVSPGLVRDTNHLQFSQFNTSIITKIMVWPWMQLFLKTPKQGCQSTVYAAVESTLEGVSGCYINNCAIEDAAKAVLDSELSRDLYERTCEIIGIVNKI